MSSKTAKILVLATTTLLFVSSSEVPAKGEVVRETNGVNGANLVASGGGGFGGFPGSGGFGGFPGSGGFGGLLAVAALVVSLVVGALVVSQVVTALGGVATTLVVVSQVVTALVVVSLVAAALVVASPHGFVVSVVFLLHDGFPEEDTTYPNPVRHHPFHLLRVSGRHPDTFSGNGVFYFGRNGYGGYGGYNGVPYSGYNGVPYGGYNGFPYGGPYSGGYGNSGGSGIPYFGGTGNPLLGGTGSPYGGIFNGYPYPFVGGIGTGFRSAPNTPVGGGGSGAARPAAIKFRGVDADINFNVSDYDEDIKQVDEFVHILRRQSTWFFKGKLQIQGSYSHKCGRWEARMGRFRHFEPHVQRFELLCNIAVSAAEFEGTSSFVKDTLYNLKEKLEAWTSLLRNSSHVEAHPRQLHNWVWGPPNLYDISGSAHFINKCDNGIVIHRNRDPEAGPMDEVQMAKLELKIYTSSFKGKVFNTCISERKELCSKHACSP
ncbi:unnamed protein product [Sphenostylis stenocarpa]|uniref:Uncharacterized protein n=1 Tax=Sphenostylis stenocarpa TaxID=92480 RepID=A0AA86VRY3_9FABA|nr:unnamed protein product [Sphenostylis stenocarpa]